MKKIIIAIFLLFISGCSTLDYNRAMGITYPAICPICKNNIGVYDTTSNFQCLYCKNTISAPEAIRLYQRYANVLSDIVTCPHCYTNQELRFLDNPSAQVIKCYYCQKDFDRAEGKRIYVQMETQRQNALAPALINSLTQQAIAQEQANQAFADSIQNIYKESAERQQQNIQTFQQDIRDWNQNRQNNGSVQHTVDSKPNTALIALRFYMNIGSFPLNSIP